MFLTPGAKLAQKADIQTPLHRSFYRSHGPLIAAQIIPELRVLQKLRTSLHEPPTTSTVADGIKSYLKVVSGMVEQVEPVLDTPLLWVNAFDADDYCSLPTLNIDSVSALFNLGVCEASMAVFAYRARKAEGTGMRDAARGFQMAAGYFKEASSKPTPGGIREITRDLYPQCLVALEKVMLGNAQQVLYHMTKEKRNANAILARFAIGASDFYTLAQQHCNDPDLINTSINAYVGKPAAALATYFNVVAQAAQAQAAWDANDMAQQLTRLQQAINAASKGLQSIIELDTTNLASVDILKKDLIEELNNMKQRLQKRLENAQAENGRMFFVSPAKEVDEIVGRQGVKAADISNYLDQLLMPTGIHMLANLPPPITEEASGIATMYADMAAKFVAEEIATISATAANLDGLVRQVKGSMDVAKDAAKVAVGKSMKNSFATLGEEQKAVASVKEAQENGGLERLREMHSQALQLATESKFQVQAIDTNLQGEDAEDRQLRSRIYTTRPTSVIAAAAYIQKLDSVRKKLEQAANADKIVAAQIEQHANGIASLQTLNLEGFVPPSSNGAVMESVQEPQRVHALIKEMEPEIEKVDGLLEKKGLIVGQLERKKQLGDPIVLTRGVEAGQAEIEKIEEIIQNEYGELKDQGKECCEEMDNIREVLSDLDLRLKTPSNAGESLDDLQEKMNEVYRHQASAMKFKELMEHLAQGIEFYSREQEVIARVKSDVDGFIAARHTEAQDLLSGPPPPPPDGGMMFSNNFSYPGGNSFQTSNPYPTSRSTNGSTKHATDSWRGM